MRKFKYKGCEFEIGIVNTKGTEYILAKGEGLSDECLIQEPMYKLFVGNGFIISDKQLVIRNHNTIIKKSDYETHIVTYEGTIKFLENLCNPKPLTIDDIYKECEGKTPDEIIKIVNNYECRVYEGCFNEWIDWMEFYTLQFDYKEAYKLGLRQVRRKGENNE